VAKATSGTFNPFRGLTPKGPTPGTALVVYSINSDGIGVPKVVRAARGSEKDLTPINTTTAISKLHACIKTISQDKIPSCITHAQVVQITETTKRSEKTVQELGSLVNWIGERNEKNGD